MLTHIFAQVTKSGPTLVNATKLLFKLSRSDKNDAIFVEENVSSAWSGLVLRLLTTGIADILVNLLETADRSQGVDALVYCCGVVKNTSTHGNMHPTSSSS